MKKDALSRRLALLLALLLALALVFPAAAEEQPAPTVRVLLTRLQLTDRADLTLTTPCTLSMEGSRLYLPRNSRVTVQIRDGRLVLFFGDAAMDAGASLTVRRNGDGGAAGGLIVAPRSEIYLGDLSLTVQGGQLQPVLTISVEDYLLGVVPYEMSDSFPLEALKVQAICARTYALGRLDKTRAYDLDDTTNDQVFRGYLPGYDRSAQAIRETAGVVVTSDGVLANCYYAASNGGQTDLPEHVWANREASRCYAVTEDPYDVENPESVVRTARLRRDGGGLPDAFLAILREEVMKQPALAAFVRDEDAFRVDRIEAVSLSKPRFESPNRLMTRLDLTLSVSGKQELAPETPMPLTWEPEDGETPTPVPAATPQPARRLSDFISAGTVTVSLPIFPAVLDSLGLSVYGANNELLTVVEEDQAFRLESRRFGHGVGMSQRGAQWMAGHYQKNYQEILEFYYPGMKLMKTGAAARTLPTADPALAQTPGPAATPTPRPTLMPVSTDSLPEGAWLASVENIDDDSSLNLRREPSSSSEILMRLYKHQRLIVLEACEDPVWVHVRTDSAEGYVMVSFLEKAE